jgi:hypothetical protein
MTHPKNTLFDITKRLRHVDRYVRVHERLEVLRELS